MNQRKPSSIIALVTSRPLSSRGSKGEGTAFRSPLLISFTLTPILSSIWRHLGPLHEDADRAGDGVGARDDVVGAEPHDVAGGCRHGPELGDDRLLLGDVAQRHEQRLAARRGAARAVDEHEQRLRRARPRRSSSASRAARGSRVIVPSIDTRAICLVPNESDSLSPAAASTNSVTTMPAIARARHRPRRRRRRRRSMSVSTSVVIAALRTDARQGRC